MNSFFRLARRQSIVATLMLSACGGASFETGSGGKATPGPAGGAGNANPQDQITSLTWYWQCDKDPGAAPATNGGDVVITGEGDHQFKKEAFAAGVPTTISGRVCPPAKYPRDIVFVIDVSGSMGRSTILGAPTGADPMIGQTCHRLKAIQSIIANIVAQSGDAKFGIVTFASGVERKSTSLFMDSANLYDDIKGGASIESVLCAATTETHYTAGLTAAQQLLTYGRSKALKEIYMISDGDPTAGYEGVNLAKTLKDSGVQVATTMVGGSAGLQLQALASLDKSGAPLHVGSINASKLAETLNKLAANAIDDGTIRYRPVGVSDWTEIALKPNMKDHDFTIPSFVITPESAPSGLEVGFEYKDLHNNKYSSEGKISWSEVKKK